MWNFKRFVHVGTGACDVIAEFVVKWGRIRRPRRFARSGKVVAGSERFNWDDVAKSRPKFKLNNSCDPSQNLGENLVAVTRNKTGKHSFFFYLQ